MTDAEIERIAQLMGARVVAKLPDVGHGASGAAHMGRFFQLRMAELRRQEQEQATGAAPEKPGRGTGLPTRQPIQTLTRDQLAAVVLEAEQVVGKLTTVMAEAKHLLTLLNAVEPAGASAPEVPDDSGSPTSNP